MLILNADQVRKSLPMTQAIDGMKRAFASLSAGQAEVPLRGRLPIDIHGALTLTMPAFVSSPDGESLALKVVSLFPENAKRGLAYIQAAVLVLEPDSGKPVGLLEGSALTAIRTGAASGAAIDILAREDAAVLAVFGAGAQGRTQVEAACNSRSIRTVWVFDAAPERARALSDELAGVGPIPRDFRVAAAPREALAEADVVCTATTSSSPVFDDFMLKPGAHVSAVGSYMPEMQELPGATVQRARLFVDSRSASLAESGDLIQPIRLGLFGPDHVAGELGEVVLGQTAGRQSADQITVFKSVGIAVQDAVAAGIAIRNALRLGIGQEVQF
jgi:ornithine cyclodeaminase